MRLADNDTRLKLSYLEAISRQGYTPTVGELMQFRPRRPARTVAVSDLIGKTFLSPKLMGAASRAAEGFLTYGLTVGWLAVDMAGEQVEDSDLVTITELGRAVLRALEDEAIESEVPTAIVLDQGDPIAHARVIGEIANLGECALVDPWFTLDELLAVLQRTKVERILTGSERPERLAGLSQALSDNVFNREVEIRTTASFHDRFAISRTGKVHMLGTSLNGVGKRFSVMVEMHEDAASNAIKVAFEAAWKEAKPLETKSPQSEEEEIAAAIAAQPSAKQGSLRKPSSRKAAPKARPLQQKKPLGKGKPAPAPKNLSE